MLQKCMAVLLAFLAVVLLSGCADNGVKGKATAVTTGVSSTAPQHLTLSGSMFLPLSLNRELLAKILQSENEAVLPGEIGAAKAFVNGENYPLKLSQTPTTINFIISSVPKSENDYRIEILWGKVGLKCQTKSVSNIILSTQTTAAVLLADKLGKNPQEILASFSEALTPVIKEIEEAFSLSAAKVSGSIFLLPDLQAQIEKSANIIKEGHLSYVYEDNGRATNEKYSNASDTLVSDNPVSVNITSPVDKSVFTEGSGITLLAVASSKAGDIKQVQFFDGNKLIGQTASPPFVLNMNSLSSGEYSFQAKAIDFAGNIGISKTVTISVVKKLSITLISPEPNKQFSVGDSIEIAAEIKGPIGSVQKVEFLDFDQPIGEVLSPPFTYSWREPAVGPHLLTAKVYSGSGESQTSEPISVVVVPPPNSPPNVSIIKPSNNESFIEGKEITIEVNAFDSDGSIARVEYYSGISKIGEVYSPPFSFKWKNVSQGVFIITAKAVDNRNSEKTSPPVTIKVEPFINKKPYVSLISPVTNSVFYPYANILLVASATDLDGKIQLVEFFEGNRKIGELVSEPWTFLWKPVKPGSYTITVHAKDDFGEIAFSEGILINIVEQQSGSSNFATSNQSLRNYFK